MTISPRHWLTNLGVFTASPYAFAIVALYGLAWAVLHGIDFHGLATLATWIMTLLIERAEHRDTQAIHAKLDELLRTSGDSRNELTHLDEREPEDVEAFREREARNDGAPSK
jgi:low affinity Fe/Cu permease